MEAVDIVKGKRTKRQRPQSPILFPVAAHSLSGDGGGGYGSGSDNFDAATAASPPTSAEFVDSTTTEEEEDMAHCLILLSQGQSKHQSPNFDGTQLANFTSKRFDGKEGMYVYQCKTCERTFPSFQALGGHRASHKKAKAAAVAMSSFSKDEVVRYRPGISPQVINDRGIYGNLQRSSSKVHECSICGAEFNSGQALGGHMRRHRAAGPTITNAPLSLSMISGFESDNDQEGKRPGNLFLDLNLPAPESHQQQHKQDSPLVLSTLVDCHY